jgi:protein transport protein YIF1
MYDECAPDLYIPIMAGITYVLISAFLTGTVGKFNPQVIPSITTYCFIIQLLEVLCIRFGFYLMQSHVAVLDLFSYTGYKYFGLCINMITAMIIGRHGLNVFKAVGGIRTYYISFIWTASALSYFMLKTMANNIPLHTSPNGPKREIMVLLFASSQLITMWLISQTKFL